MVNGWRADGAGFGTYHAGGGEAADRHGPRSQIENTTKRPRDLVCRDLLGDSTPRRALRDTDVMMTSVDSARHDEIEVAEVGVHVQREPVPGDPVARVYANGRHLARRGIEN